ncbi:MAG TPA: AI-2E family transporter [Bacillota bacterium]|nr:AI-2E family transporter [Bacillota bacterium]
MGQDVNRLQRILLRVGIVFCIISSTYIFLQLSSLFSWIGLISKTVLTPLILSIVIAYLLNPIVRLLNSRGVPRGVAVGIIYFGSILVFMIFLIKAIPAFITQAQDLTEHIPQFIHTSQAWLDKFNTHKYQLPAGIRVGIEQAIGNFQKRTSQMFTGMLDGAGDFLQKLIDLLVIPFIVFYLLKDMKMIQRGFLFFVPGTKRTDLAKLLHEIDEALESYIGGQLIVCLIVGIFAYIGYWIIDMPYAILLAFVITVTNIIPYIGPLIGAAPSILLALTVSWKMTLLVLLINLIVQILEGNVISPMIMGKRLHMHPLLIIMALLVGGELGGLLGLVFAVPIVAILRVVFQHITLHLVKH